MRLLFVRSAGYHLNSDHAVVYLMTLHAAGGDPDAVFWGQPYGGTLLQLTAAPLMLLTGPSISVVAAVGIAYWAAAAVLLRQAMRVNSDAVVANLAATLFWFPGFELFVLSTADGGFYGPSLALAFAAIWLAAYKPAARSLASWMAVGMLAGLALWTSPMACALTIPAVVFALVSDRRWRRWLAGAGAAVVAASPWLAAVAGDPGSVAAETDDSHVANLFWIFARTFPSAFMADASASGSFLLGIALVASIGGLVIRARRCADPVAGMVAAGTLMAAAVIAVGSGIPLSIGIGTHRYAAFLLAAPCCALALLVGRLRPGFARLGVAGTLAVAAMVGTVHPVASASDGFRQDTSARFGATFPAAAVFLDQHHISAAYGSHWVAYALTAVTDERLVVAGLGPRRYGPYEEAAGRSKPVIVVMAGREADQFLQALAQLHRIPAFRRTVVSDYAVFFFTDRFDVYEFAYPAF